MTVPPICLDVRGVGHRFGARLLYRDISFSVGNGDVLAVTGHNGSGKSTLLKIIAGLLQPTEGSVELAMNGEVTPPSRRSNFIGYVSPEMALYQELTAVENIRFFGALRGQTFEKIDLREMLAHVGLKGRGSDRVGDYSSGMKQRLKYLIAIMHNPELLLLDEPGANLDVHGTRIVEQIIHERREAGFLTILATNEPEEELWAGCVIPVATV